MRTDDASRITYGTDALKRGKPADIVVLTANTREVSEIARLCNRERVPLVPRGAGTGYTGGAVPLAGGVFVRHPALIPLLPLVRTLRVLARVTDKLLYPMLVWLIFTWLVPLAVDYVRWWVRGEYDSSMIGAPSCCGALGAIIHLWTDGELAVSTPGIAYQVLLAAAAAAAFYATESRWRRKAG